MGIEYDTHNWTQRSVFVVMAVLYLLLLVFVARQFLKGLAVIVVKYGRNILIMFFVSVCFAFTFRIVYYFSGEGALMLPLAPYGLCAHFPGMFLLTASLSFMNYLLRSLSSRFDRGAREAFRNYECLADVFLAIIWPVQLAIYTMAIYWVLQGEPGKANSTYWKAIFMYILLGAIMCLMPLIVYALIVYMRELRRFPFTFDDKRVIMFFVITSTTLEVICRVTNSLLINTQVYARLEKYSNDTGVPYAQLAYAAYHLCSDLLLIFSYTMYLRKDMSHLVIVMLEDSTDSRSELSKYSPSVVEKGISLRRVKSSDILLN